MLTEKKWAQTGAVFLLLTLVGFCLYGKTFLYPWLYDDFPVLVENSDIRSLGNFLANSYPGRPLRELSFLLDYSFFGLNPQGYHFQNILWHVLNGCLIFHFARVLGLSPLFSLCSALFFLVHPVNVEVIAQTSHRKDSLALFFVLVSFLLWRRIYGADRKRDAAPWIAGAVLAGIAAVLAKESAILLPLVFLLYDYLFVSFEKRLFLKTRRWFVAMVGSLTMAAVARIAYLLFFHEDFLDQIAKGMAKMADFSSISIASYYLLVFKSQAFLFSKWLLPFGLAPEYTYSVPNQFGDPWVLGGVAVLVLMVSGFFLALGRCRFVAFCLGWVLLFWIPTSNFFGHFSYFAADRYLYLPGVAIFLLAGKILEALPWRRVAVTTGYAASAGLFFLASGQVEIWSSPSAFNTRIVQVNPASLTGQTGIALAYLEEGKTQDGINLLRSLLSQYPSTGSIYKYLAWALSRDGQFEEAAGYAENGLRFDPGDPEALGNLGSYYERLGAYEKAISSLNSAISISPLNEKFHTSLGIIYEKTGRLDLAAECHRKAIELRPSYGNAYYNLGVVLFQQQDLKTSYEAFKKAVEFLPEDADALFNWGYTASRNGFSNEAEKAYATLKRIDPLKAENLMAEMAVLMNQPAGK